MEDGSIYFYKDDGTGNPFAYIHPDGTTNLTSTSGGSGSNYFIYKMYSDTVSVSTAPKINVQENLTAAAQIPLANAGISETITLSAVSLRVTESKVTATLT